MNAPLKTRRLECYIGLVFADLAALTAGYGMPGFLYQARIGLADGLAIALLIAPVFLIIALYNGAYSLSTLQRYRLGAFRAILALGTALAVLIFLAYFTKASSEYSRVIMTAGAGFAAVLIWLVRRVMRRFIAWRCGERVVRKLMIDAGGPAVQLDGAIHIDAKGAGLVATLDDPAMLDRIGEVLRDADSVLVSCPPDRRNVWTTILKSANVTGAVLDDTVLQLGAIGAHCESGHGWLRISVGPLGMRARAAKRIFDLTVAATGLVLLAPAMLLIAAAIKLEDGGPVLFVQRRVGKGNRFFQMFKFRSMTVSGTDQAGQRSAVRDDARLTRVGRLIRRTSLDELPQLFNILRGDMSVVGPRPHAVASLAGDKLFWEVDGRYWQRHVLRPGLTGLAQVRGLRGSTGAEGDLTERLSADLEYLDGWSLWRDVNIAMATLRVLTHNRAY